MIKLEKMKARFLAILMLVIIFSTSALVPAFAGSGDGSGGGMESPLSLISSSPANGQKGVATTPQIMLSFSKNVINMSVKENNVKCFSMTSSTGELVPVQVIMADDQMEPEKKRDISIKPKVPLKQGTTYKVIVAAGLEAKNGASLGSPITVNFTTAGAVQPTAEVKQTSKTPKNESIATAIVKKDKTAQIAVESNQKIKKDGEANKDNSAEVKATDKKSSVNTVSASKDQNNSKGSGPLFVAFNLVIIAVVGYFLTKGRKQK